MVDIQSAMAQIMRGEKRRKNNKPRDENIMSTSATQGDRNQSARKTRCD